MADEAFAGMIARPLYQLAVTHRGKLLPYLWSHCKVHFRPPNQSVRGVQFTPCHQKECMSACDRNGLNANLTMKHQDL